MVRRVELTATVGHSSNSPVLPHPFRPRRALARSSWYRRDDPDDALVDSIASRAIRPFVDAVPDSVKGDSSYEQELGGTGRVRDSWGMSIPGPGKLSLSPACLV